MTSDRRSAFIDDKYLSKIPQNTPRKYRILLVVMGAFVCPMQLQDNTTVNTSLII